MLIFKKYIFTPFMENSKESSESIDISSSSEIHPNIDERSYKNFKRQRKMEERRKLKEKLNILKAKNNPTEKDTKELNNLIEVLEPKYKITEDSFRVAFETVEEADCNEILVKILEDRNLENFSDLVSKSNVNVDNLEELILYNLSESIKEDNESIGLLLSKICLFLGYYKLHGKRMLDKLIDELKIPYKSEIFEEDVQKYYLESRNAILTMDDDK